MYHLRFIYGCNPAVETAFFDLKSQMEKKSLDVPQGMNVSCTWVRGITLRVIPCCTDSPASEGDDDYYYQILLFGMMMILSVAPGSRITLLQWLTQQKAFEPQGKRGEAGGDVGSGGGNQSCEKCSMTRCWARPLSCLDVTASCLWLAEGIFWHFDLRTTVLGIMVFLQNKDSQLMLMA